MNVNALQQLMNLYTQYSNLPGATRKPINQYSMNEPVGGDSGVDQRAGALRFLDFAMRSPAMAPDFFGEGGMDGRPSGMGGGMSYVRPQSFMGTKPEMDMSQSPLQARSTNYLMTLLGRQQ